MKRVTVMRMREDERETFIKTRSFVKSSQEAVYYVKLFTI